jgi:ribonuclease J
VRCRIHRGAVEVGGSCVELEHDGARLVLDVGAPLSAHMGEAAELPAASGFRDPDASLLGVVISHGHPDHYGLAGQLPPTVPLYLGAATERVLREAAFFSPAGASLTATGHLTHARPLALGPFTVTPLLADHSAFDAYSLVVDAGGRRLLYTGDVRAHGRKRSFNRLIADPPRNVDVTMLEGTRIGDRSRAGVSEQELEQRLAEYMRATDGMALVAYSPQNVDRLVTVYRAAKRSGRVLVMDLYAAAIARATGRDTIPQAEWDGVRVYVPQAQRIKVKRAGAFERVAAIRAERIYAEELRASAPRLALTFRASMTRELDAADCLDGASLAWSMWRGYYDDPASEWLRAWLATRGIATAQLHSSGHATTADLQRLAAAVGGRIVPIHTAAAEQYADLFEGVEPHPDGEWWEV